MTEEISKMHEKIDSDLHLHFQEVLKKNDEIKVRNSFVNLVKKYFLGKLCKFS